MATKKEKVDTETLKITTTPDEIVNTTSRAEIQTKIDHLELDKQKIQLEINELEADILILNKE